MSIARVWIDRASVSGHFRTCTLESAIAEARKAMQGGDLDAIKSATDTLQKASHKLAEVMYSSQGQGGGGAADSATTSDSGASSASDDVIEAEVVEEEKK